MGKTFIPVYFLTLWAAVFMLSCNQVDKDLTEEEIKIIVDDVISEFEKFENSLSNGDLETISKYYSDDPNFFWVENGGIAYPSGEAARNSIKGFYPSLKLMEFKSLDKKVVPVNESNAMLYVEYEQVLIFPSDQKIDINGAMTILMKKVDEDWTFIVGHSSGKNENQRQ